MKKGGGCNLLEGFLRARNLGVTGGNSIKFSRFLLPSNTLRPHRCLEGTRLHIIASFRRGDQQAKFQRFSSHRSSHELQGTVVTGADRK